MVKALERCAGLNVPVTITSVMMRINYDKLPELARVAATFGANLRANVYQPSKTDRFSVSYEQFWQGFRKLLEATRLVATTEPILAGVLGLEGFVGSVSSVGRCLLFSSGSRPCTPSRHLSRS
jgi:MoaA/NifB/PqqE/SkfB family radical SAM enzyme